MMGATRACVCVRSSRVLVIRKHFLVVTNLIFKKLSNPKSTNNNASFGDDAALVSSRVKSDHALL